MLMGISKRDDCYLRTLLIHGGRTVVRVAHKRQDKRNQWVSALDQRRGKNISAVVSVLKSAADKAQLNDLLQYRRLIVSFYH